MTSSTDGILHQTDLSLDRLLNEGKATGCIVALASNERPPLGFSGVIDWRIHGLISQSIRSGIISGHAGECGYIPYRNSHGILHILTIGIGETAPLGTRGKMPTPFSQSLLKNLKSIGPVHWAISTQDFSLKMRDDFLQHIPQGGSLWCTN